MRYAGPGAPNISAQAEPIASNHSRAAARGPRSAPSDRARVGIGTGGLLNLFVLDCYHFNYFEPNP